MSPDATSQHGSRGRYTQVVVDRGDNSQIKGEFLGAKTPKVQTKMPVEEGFRP